jgi:putative hydrolase of the HAD superfamily
LRRLSAASFAHHHPHARLWLVDLDNTLHDASFRIMAEINQRMTHYVAARLNVDLAAASAIREQYWHRYGATLLGLVRHHGVDADDFLTKTHPTPDELPSMVAHRPGLAQKLRRLGGQRWLLTNAPRHYTMGLLRRLGIHKSFHRLICIEDMRALGRLQPKPARWLWAHLIRAAGRPAACITLVDDSSENLKAAHRAGLQTARVWASPSFIARTRLQGRPASIRRPSYVQHQVNSLAPLARWA